MLIIYHNESGKLQLTHCLGAIAKVVAVTVPAGNPYKVVAREDLPDMDYYDAWEWDGSDADGVGTMPVDTGADEAIL
jgi:hypothetical protein